MTAPRRQGAQNQPLKPLRAPKRRRVALPPVSPVLRALSERDFQKQVVEGLTQRGWVVWVVPDMRKTRRGLPDILAIHFQKPGRLLAYELKAERTRIRPEQTLAIAHLSTVPGIDARIVRPSDWAQLSREV